MRPKAKRYFGKVCAKHPELKGERMSSNRTCLGCLAACTIAWRERNREHVRAVGRSWREKNREHVLAYDYRRRELECRI